MYYLPHDITRLLTKIDPEGRDTEIEDSLHDLAPRVATKRNEYRHFGPFWWWIKPLLQKSPGSRRSWIRGGYTDRSFPKSVEETLLTHPAFNGDDRWIPWLGLQYYASEIVDDTPAGFHIVQTGHRTVTTYSVYDADASEQIDLFDTEGSSNEGLDAFLADPRRYTGSTWLLRAEEYLESDEPFRAIAALRRAITRAVDDSDRTTAWIRLGQLFQDLEHVHKALFCYQNAYQKGKETWIQGLMGEAWLQGDEPQEAAQCYYAALQTMPGNPEYIAGYERAQRLLSQRGRAASGYQLRSDRIAR